LLSSDLDRLHLCLPSTFLSSPIFRKDSISCLVDAHRGEEEGKRVSAVEVPPEKTMGKVGQSGRLG